MLVVTRRAREKNRPIDENKIFITTPSGDIIEVIIVQLKGNQVRIGIKASEDYKVDRAEVYLQNVQERKDGKHDG